MNFERASTIEAGDQNGVEMWNVAGIAVGIPLRKILRGSHPHGTTNSLHQPQTYRSIAPSQMPKANLSNDRITNVYHDISVRIAGRNKRLWEQCDCVAWCRCIDRTAPCRD